MNYQESNNNETPGEHNPYDHFNQHGIAGMLFFITYLLFLQTICFIYLGIFPLIVIVAAVLAGIAAGFLKYKYFHYQSIFNPGADDVPKQKLKRDYTTENTYITPFPNLPVN